MPELPEVETVRSGLEEILRKRSIIKKVRLMRPDIRFQIPVTLPRRLAGQIITGVRRRAKYLLLDTPQVTLLSHLGMTGSWRLAALGSEDKHDHCYIEFEDGRRLAFRDPRRFGIIDLLEPGQEATHPRLMNLGVEPLEDVFNAEYLFKASRKRKIAAKVFIMDQRIVVGIGNIYASETFFRAQIRPTRAAGRLSFDDCERLVTASRAILRDAIVAGGSSIRDYRGADGLAGSFQGRHQVYDREGEPCRICQTLIQQKVIGGRSTFWCRNCQK
jgi:formamidopyrimidine-DNA glycosylase